MKTIVCAETTMKTPRLNGTTSSKARRHRENDTAHVSAPSISPEFGPRYQLADLFCGCGGLSLGFALTGRFDTIFGCEIKPEAVETFWRNHEGEHGRPIVHDGDIRKMGDADLWLALRSFGVSAPGKLACLVGGPPCEGFSQNRSVGAGGRPGGASRIDKFIDDPRNWLFKWFVKTAAEVRPAVVLIENVPDLVRHRDGATRDEVLDALAKAGYRTSVRVLHAADYGVPQMRRRAFFLGQRQEDYDRTGITLEFPTPTHRAYPLCHDSLNDDPNWLPGDSGYWPTVREAIGDLPVGFENDDFDHSLVRYPEARLTGLRRFLRTSDGSVPYNHLARPLGKSGLSKVRALKSGERFADLPDELRPRSGYHYSYSRLQWAEPARTITKFAYHVGSGMFAHPIEDRAITMREAARLQTFPDSFRFHSDNIRELSAMVGSAVPPLLALRIGQQIVHYLDQLTYATLSPARRATVRSQATDAVMRRLERAHWSSEQMALSEHEPLLWEDYTTEQKRADGLPTVSTPFRKV